MTDLPKYHLRAQQADALLAPVDATLRELEHRLRHYLDRLTLSPPDADAVREAHRVLADARAQIEQLWRESIHRPRE